MVSETSADTIHLPLGENLATLCGFVGGKAGEGTDFILASEIELGVAENKIGEVKSMACTWKMMVEPTRSL
ncbi:hypothetical protein ACFX2I_027305 [Malus domestica]